MSRRQRGALLAAGLIVASLVAGAAASAQVNEASADESALGELGSCIAERHELSVLFLIDESKSLQDTDPEAVRVEAMQTALEALRFVSRLEVNGATPEIDVHFATFAGGYQTLGDGWERIDADSVDRLSESVELFAARDTGFDTDYVQALTGAQEEFSQRVSEVTAEGGEPPCQLLLWFTDGLFNLIPRTTEQQREDYGTTKPWAPGVEITSEARRDEALDIGRDVLCTGTGGDQPVVDSLRRDGVINVAVALSEELGPGGLAFLESVAAGSSGGRTCGSVGADPVGALVSAGNVQDLVPAFVGPILGEGTEQDPDDRERPTCVDEPAPECTRTFNLDPGLRQFNLLAVTDAGELRVILTSPTGEELVLENGEDGEANVNDVDLEWTWITESIVSLAGRMDVDSDAWVGEWSAAFMDRTGEATLSSSQIFVFGNLRPDVPEDARLVPGETVVVPVDVVAEEGTPAIPPGLIDAIELDATAALPGAAADPIVREGDGTPFEVVLEVPDDLSARQVELTLELALTTASGVELDPVVRNFQLPVGLPDVYPTIVDSSLELPSADGTDATSADVEVRGSAVAAGCVWVEGFDPAALPDGVDSIDLAVDGGYDSEDSCLEVGEDETVELGIDLSPSDRGSGRVQGLVRFGLASDEADDARTVDVETSFQLNEPLLPEQAFIPVLLALLIPGVLLPLLFFWLMKYLLARFAPPGAFRQGTVQVEVTERAVHRVDGDVADGERLTLSARHDLPGVWLEAGNSSDKPRSFQSGPTGLSFRSRTGWNLFAPPEGRVAPTGDQGRRLATGNVNWPAARVLGDGSEGDFPLSLGGSWVFTTTAAELARQGKADDDDSFRVRGQLLLVMQDGVGSDREAATLCQAVLDQLPDAVATLIKANPAAPPAPPVVPTSEGAEIDDWETPPSPPTPGADDDWERPSRGVEPPPSVPPPSPAGPGDGIPDF